MHRVAFTRNAQTSLLTTALDFGALMLLVEIFGVNYVLATWIVTIVGALSNFAINRSWAFADSDGRAHWQLARFVPVQAGSSLLQTAGVWFLTGFGGLPYLGSKLAVSVTVFLGWNYPLNRFFVFRRPRPAVSREGSEAARRPSASPQS